MDIDMRKVRKARAPDEDGLFLLQVKIPDEYRKKIDHLAVEWNLNRAGTITELLRQGIEKYNPNFTIKSDG